MGESDFTDLLEEYSTEYQGVAELQAWATADLMHLIKMVEEVLEDRAFAYGIHETD